VLQLGYREVNYTQALQQYKPRRISVGHQVSIEVWPRTEAPQALPFVTLVITFIITVVIIVIVIAVLTTSTITTKAIVLSALCLCRCGRTSLGTTRTSAACCSRRTTSCATT
jgi:hypothetical protein